MSFVKETGNYTCHHYHPEYNHYLYTEERKIEQGMGPPQFSTLVDYFPTNIQIGVFSEQTQAWTYQEDISLLPRWYFDGSPVVYSHQNINLERTTELPPPEIKEDTFLNFNFLNQTWEVYSLLNNTIGYEIIGGRSHFLGNGQCIYDSTKYTKQAPSKELLSEIEGDRSKILIYDKEFKKWKIWFNTELVLYSKETVDRLTPTQYIQTIPEKYTLKEPLVPNPTWNTKTKDWSNLDNLTIKATVNSLLKKTDRLLQVPDYEIDGTLLTSEMKEELLIYRSKLRKLKKEFKTVTEEIFYNPFPTPPTWIDFTIHHYYQKYTKG